VQQPGCPPASLPIRFYSFTLVDAASAQLWTVSYVKDFVLADDVLATQLVLEVSRLLAAITLSAFPTTATANPTPHDGNDHEVKSQPSWVPPMSSCAPRLGA
jgi:hypothetical protein